MADWDPAASGRGRLSTAPVTRTAAKLWPGRVFRPLRNSLMEVKPAGLPPARQAVVDLAQLTASKTGPLAPPNPGRRPLRPGAGDICCCHRPLP